MNLLGDEDDECEVGGKGGVMMPEKSPVRAARMDLREGKEGKETDEEDADWGW